MNVRIIFAAALLAPAAALAQTDTASVWTLQDENAALSAQRPRDHFYTNGLRLGWASPEVLVPSLPFGDGPSRLALSLFHRIDTPADTGAHRPAPHDEPYAGVLMGEAGLITDTDTMRIMTTLGLGIAGPSAGGQSVQNWFHTVIGHPCAQGWHGQIPDTPIVEITREWTLRRPLGTFGSLQADILPAFSLGLGTLRDDIQLGATVRIGQGLDADFGVARPRFGLNGGDVFRPVRPFGWYVFAGLDEQAVGYDLLLQGSPFRRGPHVSALPAVGEAQAGFAVIAYGMRLTATYVLQTPEFRGQTGGLHQFASVSLSVRF
jgi:hypothetical protein